MENIFKTFPLYIIHIFLLRLCFPYLGSKKKKNCSQKYRKLFLKNNSQNLFIETTFFKTLWKSSQDI